MLARYLKAQLIVLVRGGLVGPIFLVTYFGFPAVLGGFGGMSSMSRHYNSWMLWAGLLITIANVPVALWLANRGAKSSALYQSGVLTTAQITGLRETGTRINERPVAAVNLHIAGPGFALDTQKRVTVDLTKQAVITARKLVVVVDPNTHDFVIDWQASGLICGVVPAQFTSVEDNRTYDLSGQVGPLMEILQIYKSNNIPFSGRVDLRSYPAVRQQVMAVVRRAAEAQQPASAGGVVAPPQQSVAERLDELQKLHSSGAISDAEYAAGRQKVIADL
jgi:hypothetical protein